jgi:hypothetical protein
MGIIVKTPPPEVLTLVSEAISELALHSSPTAGILATGDRQEIDIAAPHAVYFVGLEEVAAGNLLSAATLAGWRYLVLSGEEPVGAANVSVTDEGANLHFSHFSQGPFVNSTVEGIGVAESLKEVESADYELRLLDIPSLYVVSLWLHGSDDRIIPLPPTNQALEPYQAYSEEQMVELLKQPALDRLEFEVSDEN